MIATKVVGLVLFLGGVIPIGFRSSVVALRILQEWNGLAPSDQQIVARLSWDYWKAADYLHNVQPGHPLLRERRRLICAFFAVGLLGGSLFLFG